MLEKIERMIADLLPVVDGKPDMTGDEADIAYCVVQDRDRTKLQRFFEKRTAEDGWREVAIILARALIMVDRGHREIILEIRNHREKARFEGVPTLSNPIPQKKPAQDSPHGIKNPDLPR